MLSTWESEERGARQGVCEYWRCPGGEGCVCRRQADRVRAWPVVVGREEVRGWCGVGIGEMSVWERQGDSRVRTKSMPIISGSRAPRWVVGDGVGVGEVEECDEDFEEGGETGWEKFVMGLWGWVTEICFRQLPFFVMLFSWKTVRLMVSSAASVSVGSGTSCCVEPFFRILFSA